MNASQPILAIKQMQICQGQHDSGFWVDLPDWQLHPGQRWLVSGESGCGKSTLLEVLGLIKASVSAEEFSIHHSGTRIDIEQLWQSDQQQALASLRAQSIGFLLQTGGLLPFLSVEENIRLPLRVLRRNQLSEFADHAQEVLGLRSLLKNKPHQLSIGERQRVAFVRAIAHQPPLLLADEPTASLDRRNAERLLALMLELQQQTDTCLVLVTHDPHLVSWPELHQLQAQGWQAQRRVGSQFVS